jgi:signal peptidase II
MKTRVIGLIVAAFIFAADQFAKYMVMVPFDLKARGNIELLTFFDLTWVENYGVSMGFLTADTEMGKWLLVALTAAISVGVLIWLWREKNRQDVIALGMILGGALGNIVDRVRFGHVVDYADLHFGDFRPFLVFNVADAAISIGVVILLLRALLTREKPKENADA